MSTVPTGHPVWCDRQHNEGYPVHAADIGDQDIELGETDLSIGLYQRGGGPVRVWLCEHRHDNTTVTPLTPEQARSLGQRLTQAADSIGGGALHQLTDEHANSGPGGAP
jgi:hypothetical protein